MSETVKVPWGELYFLDPYFRKHAQEHEKEIWNHVTCPKGGGAVDVGAHQGFYTTKLAKEAGEDGSVLAFEPVPNNLRVLWYNLELNNLRNVVLVQKAVSDYEGKGEMFTYKVETAKDSAKHFLRGSSPHEPFYAEYLKGKPASPPEHSMKVDVTYLDRYIPSIRRVDIVKIDVEGAELRVLKGAWQLLKRFNPKIVLEVHYQMVNEITDYLARLGYVLTEYGNKMTGSGNPYAVFEVQ
ncbi:MAG: FkbM family methyltransferase [Candidatus Freyarchaeota archaeon]